MSSEYLNQLHNTMTILFNPQKKKNRAGHELPFGNKKMIFMGDPMQLPCINGTPIYKEGSELTGGKQAARARGSKGSRQTKLHKEMSGQQLYRLYLEPNVVLLNRGHRNTGLLQEICDRLRLGQQTDDDLRLLTSQRRRYPQAATDYGVHYDNERCSMFNWRQLWSECKSATPSKRLYICKASYHTTDTNQYIINTLSAMSPTKFNYASDVLCITEGCDVRLITNVNVSAGLVNSTCGIVSKIIYDNADVPHLLEGRFFASYCLLFFVLLMISQYRNNLLIQLL
jgi:hypothetical protein